jgi:serine/threonine protein kinase
MLHAKPDVMAIFCEALSQATAENRSNYLDEACGNDIELRSRLDALLQAHQDAGMFLGGISPNAAGTDAPRIEQAGTDIGPYKLLEQIGEGGFGVVFLAEQERPVKRRVALKIIKPGMDTRQVIGRFEAERQALAMMDHPNIAKVLDAGTTDDRSTLDAQARGGEGERGSGGELDVQAAFRVSPSPHLPLSPSTSVGRPYFVMELVQGVPITEYCDQCNLTTRERLELFVSVCQAVQHAHQKGVIHRDIKPTNVLVAMRDGRPTPKIIDFGVAKAIDQRLTEHTLATGFAQMIGTPLYMSPEQAELSPLGVDTRSDVYSLGVLLYELLTGSTPFDKDRVHAASYDELRRIIREEEPPRPSARLSTLAADKASTVADHRRTDTRRLSQSIRGELDWIVMKCLEKDRNRRYETASSLARDIERYLADEPVQACPPSKVYRFRKFARRNKSLLAAGGAIAAALVIGLGLSTWMYLRERAAVQVAKANEARATTESARSQAVSNLLQSMLVSPALGRRIKGGQYTVREMLDDFSAGLGNQLADQRETEADLRFMIGRTYFFLGAHERAEPHLKRAIELQRTANGPQHVNVADSLLYLGWNLFEQRQFDEAEPPLREALEVYRQLGIRGHRPINTLVFLQLVLASAGRHDEAERVIEQAWAEMQGYDELSPEFAMYPAADVTANCAGFAYYFATIGKQTEANEFLRRATLAQQRLRNPHDSAGALGAVAQVRLRLGDEAGYREACATFVHLPMRIGDDDFNAGRIWTCCLGPDAVEDPSALIKQAEEFAANNSMHAPYVDLSVLGAAHYRAGHYEQAAQCFEESIATHPSDPPPTHGTVLWPQLFLAMTKWQLGEHHEAHRLLSEIQPLIDKWLETPSNNWQFRVYTEVLRREAEAMIEPNEADVTVDNNNPTTDQPTR